MLRTSGHFVAQIFRLKWEKMLNSNFDFGNEYFDSDYGQRWFWDGILKEIKVDIDEIWWKLGGLVWIIFTEELPQTIWAKASTPPWAMPKYTQFFLS